MDKPTNKQLEELGLSEKEAKVYLAMIALGSAPVSDIAKRAKIKRPTAYVVLDMLSERGLVNINEQRGVRLYNAAPLDQLVEYFRTASKRYAGFAEIAKKMLPELKSMRIVNKKTKTSPKSKVQIFEGATAMRTVYEDVLSSFESIRTQAMSKDGVNFSPVTKQGFGIVPEITVQGNKIILVSPEEKFAAVVESEELANQLKKIIASAKNDLENKQLFLRSERA
jgi:sugar-specific transcriptional regulator TrmB